MNIFLCAWVFAISFNYQLKLQTWYVYVEVYGYGYDYDYDYDYGSVHESSSWEGFYGWLEPVTFAYALA